MYGRYSLWTLIFTENHHFATPLNLPNKIYKTWYISKHHILYTLLGTFSHSIFKGIIFRSSVYLSKTLLSSHFPQHYKSQLQCDTVFIGVEFAHLFLLLSSYYFDDMVLCYVCLFSRLITFLWFPLESWFSWLFLHILSIFVTNPFTCMIRW